MINGNGIIGIFLVLALSGSCAPPPNPAPASAKFKFPVQFTDYNRAGTVGDHGAGTAEVFDDAIRVVIRSGVFPFTPEVRFRLTALSAALAEGDTAARWRVTRESPKVYVSDMRTRADTLVDSVTFWIRGTKKIDLASHWLLLMEHASMTYMDRPPVTDAQRAIHGDMDLFRRAGIPSPPPNER